jgi:glycosyltransferase involved in cell wall biosynthesis
MNKSISVSIIIPSYNSYKTIQYTIEQILSFADQEKLTEIIIVDSSDDKVTKKYLNSIVGGKIKIITSGVKIMPAVQRNLGANHAVGNLLLFIDSDAYPSKYWVQQIILAYQSGYKVGGGSYLVPDFQKNSKIVLAQYYQEFGEYLPAGKIRKKKILPSCNFFCDKSLFHSINGFPQIRASEDSLFCLNVGKYSDIIYLPQASVYHIFREDKDHFLSNQHLIGKYVYKYRKNYYNSFYLKGFIFYLFIPLIFITKLYRIHTRAMKGGFGHYSLFLRSLFYINIGLLAWLRGFISGKSS